MKSSSWTSGNDLQYNLNTLICVCQQGMQLMAKTLFNLCGYVTGSHSTSPMGGCFGESWGQWRRQWWWVLVQLLCLRLDMR